MKKFLLYYWLLIFVIIVTGSGTAHANDGCGFDQFHSHMMATDPAYAQLQIQKDQAIRDYLQGNPNARITPGGCEKPLDIEVTLPVVVHIVNISATDTLITKKRVDSAMVGINQYFANVNGFGPDTKMRFALAKRDPNGNATTGINYVNGGTIPLYNTLGVTYTTQTGASINDVINLIQWDQSKYINVYVINNFITGGPAGLYFNNILMIERNFFDKNIHTFAHEMGHYFNLKHTYEGSTTIICPANADCTIDGDGICDTPPIKVGDRTTSTCYSGDVSNSVNNVMGTTNVDNRFTAGQKDRMRAALYAALWSLVLSESLIPITVSNEAAIDAIENNSSVEICDNSFVPQITLRNIGVTTLNTATIETYIDGVLKSTTNLTNLGIAKNTTRTVNLATTGASAGSHTITCIITKVNGITGDYFAMNNKICGAIQFQQVYYDVTLASDYGTIVGDGTYACNTLVNIMSTALDTSRHEFDSWRDGNTGAIVTTVPNYSFLAQENRYLQAWYKIRRYTISVNSADLLQGMVSSIGSGDYQTYVTVTGRALAGYRFVKWTENGVTVSTDSSYTFLVTTNRQLVAHFERVTATGIYTTNTQVLEIYPNPVQDVLFLKNFKNRESVVTILGVNGSIISSQPALDKIDVTDLPKGCYIIRIEDGEDVFQNKFIK